VGVGDRGLSSLAQNECSESDHDPALLFAAHVERRKSVRKMRFNFIRKSFIVEIYFQCALVIPLWRDRPHAHLQLQWPANLCNLPRL
jgi:hypothetical protein